MKYTSLKENHLFSKAYSKGKKYAGKKIVVYVLSDYRAGVLRKKNPMKKTVNRVGFTVTKKLGGAVVRNRVKRIMREALRQTCAERTVKTGFLVVIVAREAAVGKKTGDIKSELAVCFERLGMFVTARGQ